MLGLFPRESLRVAFGKWDRLSQSGAIRPTLTKEREFVYRRRDDGDSLHEDMYHPSFAFSAVSSRQLCLQMLLVQHLVT